MKKYWIAVVSNEHVKMGVEGGFAMACHGKKAPLNKMNEGDHLIYYSPTEQFGVKKPCQKFTALGTIGATEPTPHKISEEFTGWKRTTTYSPIKEVAIKSLVPQLSFIKNKKFWGMAFRRGLFSIPYEDFKLITQKMSITHL